MGNQLFKRRLVITLKSDLCAAVGDGFSGSVDIDVCHDDAGVPIIPARRIKGCLRDAGADLGIEITDGFNELFGVGGSSSGGSLCISNAALIGADEAIRDLLSDEDAKDPQKVLGLFTYTRAQTAIDSENGSARENTLRFVRVVKQYMPLIDESADDASWQPTRFVAEVSCADNDKQKELLSKCCKALRAMGYGRNRGFGAVSCKLEEIDDAADEVLRDSLLESLDNATRVSYTVRLDSPLMLSQQHGAESADYIPGTSVLGLFARLLSKSDDFDKFFLQGRMRFSPLYPVADGKRCCPAPSFIVKLKGGERDGKLCSYSEQELYGGTPKPLKNGFISSDLGFVKPETEVVYHNSIMDKDGGLYTQRCLKAGQLFSGFIEGDSDSIAVLVELLTSLGSGGITFGRSKTAQYSRCTLVGIEKVPSCETMSVKQGKCYAFLLDSDALILRDGAYSTDFKVLEEEICGGLGRSSAIYGGSDIESAEERIGTGIRYRTLGGYNAKWNQKKPHVRGFEAGGCIVFQAANDVDGVAVEFFIGERQAEGLGRVLLARVNDDGTIDLPLDSAPLQFCDKEKDSSSHTENDGDSIESMRCVTVEFADSTKKKFLCEPFGRAFIGRLARMVDESDSRDDFDGRVDSIKADAKKDAASELIRGFRKQLGPNMSWTQEKECLALLFMLGKYYAKQGERTVVAGNGEGGAR